jgi:hypothetical protein
MHHALQYIKKRGGVHLERDYPYLAQQGNCRHNLVPMIPLKDFEICYLPKNSPLLLKRALLINPVCIAVDGSDFGFLFYKDGIYDKIMDEKDTVNHAVLLTAFDEQRGIWTIKNSWGQSWGNNGFMKLKHNEEGSGTAGMYEYCIMPIHHSVLKPQTERQVPDNLSYSLETIPNSYK